MWEQLNWPTIIGESISGLVGGIISGILILGVTYIINTFDNKRRKEAEKEFLLTKEEIKNIGEIRKIVDKNLLMLQELRSSNDFDVILLTLKNTLENQILINELMFTGMFNEDNIKFLREKYKPIDQNLITISNNLKITDKNIDIKKDRDLLETTIKQLTDFRLELVIKKKEVYLDI